MDIELSADYGEQRDKEAKQATVNENVQHLDITGLPIQVAVRDINLVTNDTYIMLRRHSLGASDSSVVLGCNPFKNREELIAEKIAKEVTAEERAIGEKIAVRKGRDLEPLILEKFKKVFLQEIIKPSDMYVFKDYPFLSINFDGVTGEPGHYTPAEIKVVTMYGEKHYDFSKAIYNEQFKAFFPLPQDISQNNWSIENKAAFYGIPPYYYTQVQQQIFGLNSKYGYLSVLCDRDWYMRTFYIPRDQMVIDELIIQGYKLWNIIEAAGQRGFDSVHIEKYENALVKYMKKHHISWNEAKNAVPVLDETFMS